MATHDMYRREAVRHHATARVEPGLLRITPQWLAWSYRLFVAMCVAAMVAACLVDVSEWASGPALVRLSGRVDVTVRTPGVVATIEVTAGQAVESGAILLRLHSADEQAALLRIERELEANLLELLRTPEDDAKRQALTSLRAQRAQAVEHLEEKVIRASSAGRVGDVRVRVGQSLAAGEVVASVASESSPVEVVALLPGRHRPLLHVGDALRLQMDGYPFAYQRATILSVADDVVGPAEAARYLGADRADAISLQGPLVIVRASLPATTFSADGETHRYFDGMHASAEVRLHKVPFVYSLFPALRHLTRHGER